MKNTTANSDLHTISTVNLAHVMGGQKLSLEESIKKYGPFKLGSAGTLAGCDNYADEDARSCL
jgi:hypothetical protein